MTTRWWGYFGGWFWINHTNPLKYSSVVDFGNCRDMLITVLLAHRPGDIMPKRNFSERLAQHGHTALTAFTDDDRRTDHSSQ